MSGAEMRTMTGQELMEAIFPEPRWFVEGLLTSGLTILAGDPKIGKSFFILQLLQYIATGTPFLGLPTIKAATLYLALEDTFSRIQRRLWAMDDESSDDLIVTTQASTLDEDLLNELDDLIEEHPGIGVIAIDTLRLVRGDTPNASSAYNSDYRDVNALKAYADERDVAMILVHHTRKVGDADVYKTLSGSQAIMGAADQTMVLERRNRADETATLHITGRDVEQTEFDLRFNDCKWEIVERLDQKEICARQVPSEVQALISFAATQASWDGTASALAEELGIARSAAVLGKLIAQHKKTLVENGVSCISSRTGTERRLSINYEDPSQ